MSQIAEQLQLFDEGTVDKITVLPPAHRSTRAASRRGARAADAGKPTVVDEMLRLWAKAKPRDRKKLLVTIDQTHRLHKQTAKPAGRVTAGAASASDKRVNAAITATKALTAEEIAVFAEWFSDYHTTGSMRMRRARAAELTCGRPKSSIAVEQVPDLPVASPVRS